MSYNAGLTLLPRDHQILHKDFPKNCCEFCYVSKKWSDKDNNISKTQEKETTT